MDYQNKYLSQNMYLSLDVA